MLKLELGSRIPSVLQMVNDLPEGWLADNRLRGMSAYATAASPLCFCLSGFGGAM
jgi:hypothetical protein